MTNKSTTTKPTRTTKSKKRGGPGSGRPAPAIVVGPNNFEQHFPPPAKKIGAPTKYSDELAGEIFAWLELGRSLRSYCLQPGTPGVHAINHWRKTKPDFEAKFTQARRFGIEQLAETALDEASVTGLPPEQATWARLALDARKWYASKLHSTFADRARHEVSGPDGAPLALQVDVLIQTLFTPDRLELLSDGELATLSAALNKLAAQPIGPQVIEGTITKTEETKD
jgi:hypothetical protein